MIISSLIVLVTSEFIIRMIYGVPSRTIKIPNIEEYYKRDDELSLVPRKNVHGEHKIKGKFTSTFRTNSRGLRDKEYTLNKPEGIKRIVVIGDSFTWGLGVNDDEIYTERLESMLPNTEVINLGVVGYNTVQETIYFQREGIKYDPDILIIQFYSNDILRYRRKSRPKSHIAETDNISIIEKISKHLFYKSALYRFIRDRVYTNNTLVKILKYIRKEPLSGIEDINYELRLALRETPEIIKVSWEETASEILNIKQYATGMGIRVIVAVVPTAISFHEKRFKHAISYSIYDATDFDLNKPYRILREFAAENNIEIIIPFDIFKQASRNVKSLYHKRDGHFNAEGHNLFAQAIADYLSSKSPDR